MAAVKTYELREHSSEDLRTRLNEAKEEYFNLRFQNATGQLDNFKQLGKLKRAIARIETIMHERELDIEGSPEPTVQASEKSEKKARRWRSRKSETAKTDEAAAEEPEQESENE